MKEQTFKIHAFFKCKTFVIRLRLAQPFLLLSFVKMKTKILTGTAPDRKAAADAEPC